MQTFGGFPIKSRMVKIPAPFFTDLLPQIDDLNELRVTLYCFWRLQNKGDQTPYLWQDEIAADNVFMAGLGSTPEEQEAALRDGLERAVARGALLRAEVRKGKRRLYFINTPRGRAMAEGAASGKWNPQAEPEALLSLTDERPNLFTLYEQNIGPLTQMIAEKLKAMEQDYPTLWIEEAIGIAVVRNKRNIAYVEGILKRWNTQGRGDTATRDGWYYVSGKYKDEIEN